MPATKGDPPGVRLVVFMKSTLDKLKAPTETGQPYYKWSMCVKTRLPSGAYSEVIPVLESVTFGLHETFPNPNRVCTQSPFRVVESAWGQFDVQVALRFKPGSGLSGDQVLMEVPLNFPDAPAESIVEKTDNVIDFPDALAEFLGLVEATHGRVDAGDVKKRKRGDSDEHDGSAKRGKKKRKPDTKIESQERANGSGGSEVGTDGTEGTSVIDWETIKDHILSMLAKHDDQPENDALPMKKLRKVICDKVVRRELKKHEKAVFKQIVNRVVEDYDEAGLKGTAVERFDLAERIEKTLDETTLCRVATLVGSKGCAVKNNFEFDIFNLHPGVVNRINKIMS